MADDKIKIGNTTQGVRGIKIYLHFRANERIEKCMIFVTGDIHGDIERFSSKESKAIKKGDTLLVCGDFGFVWEGSKSEQKLLKKLGKKKYHIAFVDGSHENHELINKYEKIIWNGAEAHKISGNLVHLISGNIYEIEGKKVFVFGGGEPLDTDIFPVSQESSSLPTLEDLKKAVDNIKKENFEVDLIITHEPPEQIKNFLNLNNSVNINIVNSFLDEVGKGTKFEKWYFGHCHCDKVVTKKHTAVFNRILQTEERAKTRKKSKKEKAKKED